MASLRNLHHIPAPNPYYRYIISSATNQTNMESCNESNKKYGHTFTPNQTHKKGTYNEYDEKIPNCQQCQTFFKGKGEQQLKVHGLTCMGLEDMYKKYTNTHIYKYTNVKNLKIL